MTRSHPEASTHIGQRNVSIRQHTSAYVSIRRTCVTRSYPEASTYIGQRNDCEKRATLMKDHVNTARGTVRTKGPCIRQHTSACVSMCQRGALCALEAPAYVSMRQHTSTYLSICQHASARGTVRNRGSYRLQHTSAYVSIRQHTSAYVTEGHCLFAGLLY